MVRRAFGRGLKLEMVASMIDAGQMFVRPMRCAFEAIVHAYIYPLTSHISSHVASVFFGMLVKSYTLITLQGPLLPRLLIALDSVADLEVLPVLERDAALGVLAHRLDVLLLVLDVVNEACVFVSGFGV